MSLEVNFSTAVAQIPAVPKTKTGQIGATLNQDRKESIFRLVTAGIILLVSYISEFAISWDVQWHSEVGRDNFWTPPHLLLYSCTAVVGLLALAAVLVETLFYYRKKPAVTAKTTSAFLGIFHAPLGFYIVGFAVVIGLIAAPFDDYWHQLYGVDVTIWAPFHMMGIFGTIFGGTGLAYCFASEYNRSQRRIYKSKAEGQMTRLERGFTAAALLALAFSVARTIASCLLLVAQSDLGSRFSIPQWQPLMYPGLIAFAIPGLLLAVVVATGRPGMAVITALIFSAMRLVFTLTIPGAVDNLVASEGLNKRPNFLGSRFLLIPETYPYLTVFAGIIIDAGFIAAIWMWSHSRFTKNTVLKSSLSPVTSGFRNYATNFSFYNLKGLEADKSLQRRVLSLWTALIPAGLAGVLLALTSQPYQSIYNEIKRIAPTISLFGPNREITNFLNNPPNLLTALPLVLAAALASGLLGRYLGLLLRYTTK